MLRMKQPLIDDKQSKPVSFLQTPEDYALFRVMHDCFNATLTKLIGYEAKHAHVEYSMKSYEEMQICINIKGFSDNLLKFAVEYIDILLACAKENGFERDTVRQSIAKMKTEYSNSNNELD